ncbi:hypothetical protein B0H13DRAFT_293237 [Mycena leptocephala]|nr:hypothetical protein B0H13DRAFT_293237 [Mycena leptocephala]
MNCAPTFPAFWPARSHFVPWSLPPRPNFFIKWFCTNQHHRTTDENDLATAKSFLDSWNHPPTLLLSSRICESSTTIPLLSTWVVNEARTLARVLPLLDLKRISVRCTTASLDWDSMHRGLKTSLQSVFASPRLESIQLHGMLISAPPECALFHIFMDSHANLQHLSFSYRLRRHRDRSLFVPPVWEPKLRSLVIDANHVIDILHGLSSSAMDYSRLRTLTLSGFIDSEIGELLTAIKGRNVLEDLNIYYPNSENSDTGWLASNF